MAETVDTVGSDSAEKAYAAAAESAVAKADAVATAQLAELEFPAKPARASAAEVAPKAAAPVIAAPAIAVTAIAAPAKPEADLVTPTKQSAKIVKTAPVAASKAPVAAKKAAAAKPVAITKTVAVKMAVIAKKAVVAKPVKPASPKINTTPTPTLKIKETIMATKQTKDFTNTVKTVAADVQAKAKLALAKGSEVLGEAGTFTKGNVEALVASGKILGTGLQGLGKTYAAEGKSAYETVTADVKDLAQVKSPVDFVRLQTSILRRNFNHAFDFGGKNSAAVLKLAGEAFAPISARASLAVAKIKKAA